MQIASKSSTGEAGSLKASEGVLLLSNNNRDNSVKQSSGLETENELYLTADGIFPSQNHQRTRIILCFSVFSQLWQQPVGTDINSQF